MQLRSLAGGLAAWFLAAWFLAALLQPALAQDLNDAERNWIAAHGAVKVVLMPSVVPFYQVPKPGAPPSGYAIEMLDLVAQRTGLQLRYVHAASIDEGAAMLRDGRADMTPLIRMSSSRERLLSSPGELIPLDFVVVTRRDATELSSSRDFEGRRVAVVEGSVNDELMRAEFPLAQVVRFPTLREALIAVAEGRADLAPSTLQESVYIIESQLMANLHVRPMAGAARGSFGPGVVLTQPLLHSVLVKAIASVTPAERARIARRWLPEGRSTVLAAQALELTTAERAWVERAGQVRAGFDASFAPFTSAAALGAMEGLGADVLRAVAAKTGLRITDQSGGAFAEIYDAARSGRVNVIVGMARSAQRAADFYFVGPFSTVPTAMVMRSQDPRLWPEPDDMPAGSVGLLREHFLLPRLQLRKPGLRLVEYDSQLEVLEALAAGDVDAAIGNSVVVSRMIDAQFSGRLRLTGALRDADSELFFGVPRSDPQLARVLEQGLAALSPSEIAGFNQRWLFVSLQPGLRWIEVLRWTVPIGLGLLLLLWLTALANRRLKAAHVQVASERAQAVQATEARARFLAYLAHEIRGTVGGIAGGADLLLQPKPTMLAAPMLEAIRSSANGLHALLDTTLEHERSLVAGVTITPKAQALGAWWQETLAPLTLQAASKGLLLDAPAADARCALDFDGPRLAQVVWNLGGNAIKFSAQGRVRLACRWNAATQWLRIEVEDDGPGIAEPERAQLFEPYAQGDAGVRSGRGAGLGLAISKQIVDAMGGRIELAAGRERGSLFVVELPVRPASSGAVA